MISIKKVNFFSLLSFILLFTGVFCVVEVVQEKSSRKRLAKREVNAIGEFVKFKCPPNKKYNPACIDKILKDYLEIRKDLFKDIPKYIKNSKIRIVEKTLASNVGVDEKKLFRKDYSLPFHKYYDFLGFKIFLEEYSTTALVYDHKDQNYSFIIATIDQMNLIKSSISKSLYYMFGLIFIILIYIFYFKEEIDYPFFYEKRDRITTKYFIFLIIVCALFILSKNIIPPYNIGNVYPWILLKMNPYKLHEFAFYVICSIGFLIFYIFKENLKRKVSYRSLISEKFKKIRNSYKV